MTDPVPSSLLRQEGPQQEGLFPIQRQPGAKAHRLRIPWSVAEKAYAVYSAKFGKSQSLERMAERGGFCPDEMDDFHPNWREESDEIFALKSELAAAQARIMVLEGSIDYLRNVIDHPVTQETTKKI